MRWSDCGLHAGRAARWGLIVGSVIGVGCGTAPTHESCNVCPSAGETTCSAGQARTCMPDSHGCLTWGAPVACPGASCQDGASCAGCSNTCAAAGQSACTGGLIRTCTADAHGCLAWSAGTSCASGVCADASSCGGHSPCALPWGGTLDDGASTTAYASSSVACGDTCDAEVRVCHDGTLSGSDSAESCSAGACSCALPWGGTLDDGASTTAYASSSVACGGTCASEERVCTHGTLSGSDASQTCSVAACPCALPWGGTLDSGASAPAYEVATVPNGQSCDSVSEARTCSDGTLSGSYPLGSCMAHPTTQPPGAPTEVVDPGTGANPLTDFLIQDVCVDDADRPISGDPATCPQHRDLKFGEMSPYIKTTGWPGGALNAPAQDSGGSLLVMNSRFWSGANGQALGDYYGEFQASGFDLYEANGLYSSILGTQDQSGGYQLFTYAGCPEDTWVSFPMDMDLGNTDWHTISGGCQNYTEYRHIGPYAYSTGTTLDTIVSYHYAGSPGSLGNMEAFYYTREYGMTMWQSWVTDPSAEGTDSCPGPTHQTFPDGRTRYRWACGDTSAAIELLDTPINPLANPMGRDLVFSKNLLVHGDFPANDSPISGWSEWSNTDWGEGVGRQIDMNNGYMKLACWHAGSDCAGASVYQDVDTSSLTGNVTLRYGAILKMTDASQTGDAAVQLFMYAPGGAVVASPSFSAHADGLFWRHFDGTFNWDFSATPISSMRFQVYIENPSVEYDIDDAYLTPSR